MKFIERADFDLDRQPGRARILDCLAHSTRRRDVIVLDQDRVEQAHAMVCHSARGRGGLLQTAQPRRGLAGIEHPAVRCLPRSGGEPVRQRGDAGEALQKIQRHTLAFEQRSGIAGTVAMRAPS